MGSYQSGIMRKALTGVLEKLGIEYPIRIYERVQDLAEVPETLLKRFGVDTRYVFAVANDVEEFQRVDGFRDCWGLVRHKPAGVIYYEFLEHPMAGLEDRAGLRKISWPAPIRAEGQSEIRQRASTFQKDGYAVGTTLPGLFEHVMYLVGTEKFMIDMATNQTLFLSYYERVLEALMGYYEHFLTAMAGHLDFACLYSDFSSQQGPLFSPSYYRQHMRKLDTRWLDFVRSKSGALIAWHTCGAASEFFPDLIDMGVSLVNPIQVSARGMEPARLKKEFGRDLAFWGGIDTQSVLPFGSPSKVKEEVKRRIQELSADGGYLLAAVHNIQADVPPENCIAMYEAALEYGASLS
jgi:uroporphyrinogen decarboxylase